MSAWIVYSKDGKTERCRLKALEYSGSFMADRAVTATFECHSEVAFEVFDYIVYRGEKFELESVPSVKKTSSDRYEYELRFVSLKYELERCEMRDIVPNDNGVVYPTPLTFSFTGDVRYLAERIQANLDALYGKDVWRIVVSENAVSDEKNITIAQQNCWNALSLVNTTYGLNFSVHGREVVIGGELDSVDHTFQYGKGNGLYEIERASDTNTGIVTKLRAYGGTKNLDYSYPKQPEWGDSVLPVSFALSPLRLMLPSFKEDGKTDFVLADEATIAEYGIREASIIYEDIYPSITGATNANGEAIDEIAGVDEIDESKSAFVVYLHDLGFDLNEHLTTSEAQLSMKTGTLQGYTFNISAIERLGNGGYKITLGRNSLENSEETGAYVPSKNWNMKAGDKFVLLNILMPQTYIREAEQRLLARANEYLAEYSKTNFSYNVGLHDKFLVEHTSVYDSLIEGVKLNVYDAELGISEYVTIQSITITEDAEDNILPQVKVTLNNKPSASTLDRIQGKLNDVIAETSANGFSSQSELMKQYRKKLDKPFFDKLFSAVDADGNEIDSNDVSTPIAYIKAKYDFMVLGGVTMYGNDESLDLPTLAEGLPFDQRTIWFNPDTKQIEVIGGTGGGEGGVSNFWDLSGIPSWITNTKPVYNYSEIKNTPDLSGYATTSSLNAVSTKLNDFLEGSDTDTVINKWKELETFLSGLTESDNLATILTGKADKSYVDTNFVTIAGTEDVTGLHNFVNGLKIGGIELIQKNGNAFLKGNLVVEGGITMYGDGEGGSSVPSYSTLGSLLNVDESNDSVASVDRVLFQSAGSNVWSWKALSEIGGGSSGGGSVSGDYLPLSGGTISGDLTMNNSYGGLRFINTSNNNLGFLGYSGGSAWYLTDSYWINSYSILHSGNYSSYALPLSGGTINGAGDYLYVPLFINALNNQISGITFKTNGTERGHVGHHYELGMRLHTASTAGIAVSNSDVPIFYTGNGSVKNTILHAGNYSSYALPLSGGTLTSTNAAVLALNNNLSNTAVTFAGTTNNMSVGVITSDNGGYGYINVKDLNGNSLSQFWVEKDQISFHLPSSNKNYIVLHNGNIANYNAGSATKLQTARTVWGQSFDGSGNVSGALSGATTGTFSESITIGSPIFSWGTLNNSGSLYQGGKIHLFNNAANNMNQSSPKLVFSGGAYEKGVYLQGINVASYGRKRLGIFVENTTAWENFQWVEAMSILPSGNVGIGTTSPAYKLDVSGYIRASKHFILADAPVYDANVNSISLPYSTYIAFGGHIALRGEAVGIVLTAPSSSGGSIIFRPTGNTDTSRQTSIDTSGNMLVSGGITMYSDQRKKTILNHVELSLKQIADAPLIEHYYNSDQDKTTHVGSIAQYWASMNDWFCKLDAEGFYTMEIQNCALASAISIARELVKYESKTDRTIRKMKQRIQELEDEVERLKKGA